jgi:hypothetical protein
MSINVINKGKTDEYVYDISLDGTVVNALGMNILSNTDGFNFQMPKESDFRYTEEHPYISNGGGRNSIKGKAYTGVDADVAEFEDLYMHSAFNGGINKNGLGIDEYCNATINFARKNYADLLENGKIKMVGNTIKSKKMPIYIEKFLGEAIKLLLNGNGAKFLEYYYDYIEKIYNMKIPLRDIATVGKIKTSIETYKENCKKLTAAGTKKARQAWYELAIRDNLAVNMGDAIYYINTGNKKSTSDIQRITKLFFINKNGDKVYDFVDDNGEVVYDKKGNPISLTKQMEKEFNKLKKTQDKSILSDNPTKKDNSYITLIEYARKRYPNLNIQEEDQIIFNCIRLSNDIVEDDDEHYCDDNFEYNREKYISMFNKRIRPLLVCFDKSIRTKINDKGKEVDNILITNPKDRKTFTEDESKLVSGQPYNAKDQDSYEQLMTIENKEIKFWLTAGKIPPYVKECGIDWDKTVEKYNEYQKQLEREGVKAELEQYNRLIDSLKESDVEAFNEDGILPDRLMKLIDINQDTYEFISKKWGIVLGSMFDILDKDFSNSTNDDENEEQ